MSKDIPSNWVWAPMLDIIDYEGGSQPPKKDFIYEPRKGYVRLLQIRDFGDKPFPTYVPDSNRLKKVNADDLLLARYGGSSASNDSLGRVCTGLEGAYNVALAKLIFSRESLERDYVKYLLMGPWFKDKVGLNSRSCQTGFNRNDVIDIKFPLAPLNEQKRIVVKLEKLLGNMDASQKRLAKIPAILRRFRQSVLASAYSGQLTNDWRKNNPLKKTALDIYQELSPKEKFQVDKDAGVISLPSTWIYVPIGNISGFQQGMQIAKSTRFKEGGPNRLPILRIGNYANGFTEDIDYVKVDEQTLIAEANDIILARTGETRGKVLTGHRGVFHNNTFRMNYDKRLMLREYLIYWLQTPFVQSFINQSSGRSAQPDLTHKAFGPCPFALAPVEEQGEIVRRIESLLKLIDQIEARYNKAQMQVDKLTQSILAKAFRGELLPQDPNDEPASVLLERIKASKN